MTVEKEGTAFSTIQRSKPKEILVVEHEVKFYQNINLSSDSDRNAGIPLFAGTRCELKAGAKVTTVCLIGVYNCHILTAGNNYAVFERLAGLRFSESKQHPAGVAFAALQQQHLDCFDSKHMPALP
jgi:hypothetical protein